MSYSMLILPIQKQIKMIRFMLLLLITLSAHHLNSELQVTYVTGLWNVARGDMVIFKRTFDYYLKYFNDLLQTNHKFIIFGSQQVKSFVQGNRRYKDNIQFVQKSLSDFQEYWYTALIGERIDQVKKDWLKWQRYSILPQYGLRMYNPVVMSKLRLVMEASLVDPFNSDYYVWIDGGFTHSIDKAFIQNDVLGHFFRNYQPDWVIQAGDLNFHPFQLSFEDEGRKYANITTEKRYLVWGNWLGGKATAASTAYHIFENFLRYTLQEGDMNTDEAVFFFMLQRYSWLFRRSNALSFYKFSLENQIEDGNYPLRVINATDLIMNGYGIEGDTDCEQQKYIRIVYDAQKDLRYYNMVVKSLQSCLKSRAYILIGLLISLLYVKWHFAVTKRTAN